MPVTRSGRRNENKKKGGIPQKLTILPIALVVILIGGLAGALWFGERNSVPTDPDSLCRTDQPPPSISVILLDVTDSLSEGEQNQIENEIERLRSNVERFGLLEIYAMGRSSEDIKTPKISLCNPGRGGEMNAIYQNPILVEQRWQEVFATGLKAALTEIISESDSDQSLILESIRAIGLTDFGRADYDNIPKNLYIFSDLLQHVPSSYSQYQQPLSAFQDFRNTEYASQIATNLSDINVELFYIVRPKTAATANRNTLVSCDSQF